MPRLRHMPHNGIVFQNPETPNELQVRQSPGARSELGIGPGVYSEGPIHNRRLVLLPSTAADFFYPSLHAPFLETNPGANLGGFQRVLVEVLGSSSFTACSGLDDSVHNGVLQPVGNGRLAVPRLLNLTGRDLEDTSA